MKILVCISNVPDTTTKINFNDDNKSLKTDGVQFIINPSDNPEQDLIVIYGIRFRVVI